MYRKAWKVRSCRFSDSTTSGGVWRKCAIFSAATTSTYQSDSSLNTLRASRRSVLPFLLRSRSVAHVSSARGSRQLASVTILAIELSLAAKEKYDFGVSSNTRKPSPTLCLFINAGAVKRRTAYVVKTRPATASPPRPAVTNLVPFARRRRKKRRKSSGLTVRNNKLGGVHVQCTAPSPPSWVPLLSAAAS